MAKSGRLMGRAMVCFALAAALLAPISSALAQQELIRVDAQGPVDIRADQVEYDEKTATYFAQGEVEIARGEIRMFADRVRLFSKTLLAEAEGKVRLTGPDQIITGERMAVDLQGGTGKIYKGQVFIRSSNYYLRGDEIEKTGKDTYHIRHGSFTTCDGTNPAWNFTGRDIDVTIDGYGYVRDSVFRIKDFPVFWTPYLIFPAKFKRQSGLLSPTIGNSNRDGFIISQPYFQTLGEDQDMTLTVNYMSKRGVDLGLEYRYHQAPGSKGMFMVDYLHKDQMGQDLFDQGELAKPYDSRYWFRGMAEQNMFNGNITMKSVVDLVSDQDYLREFLWGNSGFYSSNDRFAQWFGRELDPYGSLTRQSYLNIQRSWSSAIFNGSLIYNDQINTNNKTTLQRFPELTFNATRQPVGETGLYFQMASSYIYYYRTEGTRGSISDLSPSVSLPLNFNDYLELEPSFTYSPRLYSVSLSETENQDNTKNGINQLWSFGTQASTYVYRVFDFGTAENPFKIKHALRPFINYSFQPKEQDADAASLARRTQSRVNQLSYGIENSFTTKIMGKDPESGEIVPVYREAVRLNFAHSFDLSEYRSSKDEKRYWGNVTGRLEFEPTDLIYLQAYSSWNLYKNRFEQISGELTFSDYRGDEISLDYYQIYGSTHQASWNLKLAVTNEWSLKYIRRLDFVEEQDFEQTYEVRYEGQCWGVRFFYTDNLREDAFYVAFSLGGFGELFGWGKTKSIETDR